MLINECFNNIYIYIYRLSMIVHMLTISSSYMLCGFLCKPYICFYCSNLWKKYMAFSIIVCGFIIMSYICVSRRSIRSPLTKHQKQNFFTILTRRGKCKMHAWWYPCYDVGRKIGVQGCRYMHMKVNQLSGVSFYLKFQVFSIVTFGLHYSSSFHTITCVDRTSLCHWYTAKLLNASLSV